MNVSSEFSIRDAVHHNSHDDSRIRAWDRVFNAAVREMAKHRTVGLGSLMDSEILLRLDLRTMLKNATGVTAAHTQSRVQYKPCWPVSHHPDVDITACPFVFYSTLGVTADTDTPIQTPFVKVCQKRQARAPLDWQVRAEQRCFRFYSLMLLMKYKVAVVPKYKTPNVFGVYIYFYTTCAYVNFSTPLIARVFKNGHERFIRHVILEV